ncbi:MAG: hypothetical protein V3R71_07700, partial [Gemmatimonadales bacterium]
LPAGLLIESEAVELHVDNPVNPDSLIVRAPGGGAVLAALAFPIPDISWAVASPDGSRMAYVRGNPQYYLEDLLGNDVPTSIWLTGLDEWVAVRITPDEHLDTHPIWLGNDRLLFVSNRDGQRDIYLVALKTSGEPDGEPTRVTTGAEVHTLSVTPDGTLAAYSKLRFRSNLYEITLPEQGSVSLGDARPLTRESAVIEQHSRSTDGRVLVYDSNISGQQDIYLMPMEGGEAQRLTTDPGQDMDPELSPDGSEVVFYSTRHGTRDIYSMDVDGQNERRLTGVEDEGWAAGGQEKYYPSYSPNGLHLAFSVLLPDGIRFLLTVISRDSVGGPWGPPDAVADSVAVPWPTFTWVSDNQHLIYSHAAGGLRTVSSTGEGESVVELGAMTATTNVRWPYIAPDGRLFFQIYADDGTGGIYATDQAGAEPRIVVRFDDPRIVPMGMGITVRGSSMILTVSEKESDIYVMELEY